MLRAMTCSVYAFIVLTAFAPASFADDPTPREPVFVVSANGPDRDAKQPHAAVDPDGRIYVVFGLGNSIRLAASEDGGKTFRVSTVGSVGSLALGMRRGPRIVATAKALVVTAIGGAKGGGQDGDVLAWRSVNHGKTWAGPTRVNAIEGSAREGLHGMASGPDGSVFCTWLDLRNKGTEIYGALSKDDGATWMNDALVYRSPDKTVCECCHPSVAFGGDGTLHVMWRNQLRGNRDLYLTSSKDGGKTFGAAGKLGRGTWLLKGCPMDGGAVAAGPDGQVDTVWMRAGSMFAATPGGEEQELGRGVQGWTAIGPDGPYRIWLESRPGELLSLTPRDKSPVLLAENASDPMVASGPKGGPVVIVWESKNVGGIESLVISLTPKNAGR